MRSIVCSVHQASKYEENVSTQMEQWEEGSECVSPETDLTFLTEKKYYSRLKYKGSKLVCKW